MAEIRSEGVRICVRYCLRRKGFQMANGWMQKPKCKDCQKREMLCHAKCEEYISWRKARTEEMNRIRMENDVNYALTDMAMNWGRRR